MADAPIPKPPALPERDDRPRHCLRCRTRLHHDPLFDAGPPKCPRCGRPYVPDRPETYAAAPMPLRWRFWVPGLVVSILSGVSAYMVIRGDAVMGYTLFLGVPLAAGAVLGYSTRASIWLAMMLGLTAIACIVFTLLMMDLTGIFCGLTLGAIFLGPTFLGVLVGWLVRVLTREAAWGPPPLRRPDDLRRPAPGGRAGRGPLADGARRGRGPHRDVFPGPPHEAWGSILFYEQVEHEPPLLLKLALPRPVRAEGRNAAVGDVQTCLYQKGYLRKTITRREEGRLLAFDVTEQHLHFEHDVELLDGAFALEPIDGRRTRVVLSTRYRRLLRPAWLWQPMERKIIRTLHEHVLTGMRHRLAEGAR
jgi:hypothetical protein